MKTSPPTGCKPQTKTLTHAVDRATALVLEAWAKPVDPAPAWVVAITEAVAIRWLNNPKGLSSLTISIDDASRTERRDTEEIRTGFYLTDEEARRLAAAGGPSKQNRVGSIRLAVPGYQS